MNTMHLIGSEQVQSAGNSISRAADTISSAASTIDQSVYRMAGQLETHGHQMEALIEAMASAPTLHDQFAMAAMQGLLARKLTQDERGRPFVEWVVELSFEVATAMMKAREA